MELTHQPMTGPCPLVLFDGPCNLCRGFVGWVIVRDRRERFRFAALQSNAACVAIERAGASGPLPDSIVVIDERGLHVLSDAVLAVARGLPLPWSLARHLRFVPGPLRDALYRWVAARRMRWFGKQDTCALPLPGQRERFLDADEPRASSG